MGPSPNSENSQSHQNNQGGFLARFSLRRLIRERRRRARERLEQKIKEVVEQAITQEVRQSLQTQTKERFQEVLSQSQFNIDEELNNLVNQFTKDDIGKAREKIEQVSSNAKDEIEQVSSNAKDEIERVITNAKDEIEEYKGDLINEKLRALKDTKAIKPELVKMRAVIILLPVILIAFSFTFRDRIQDIMKIDVLEEKIESLRENVKSLQQPNDYTPTDQGACQPGDESCCSPEDGFFSC